MLCRGRPVRLARSLTGFAGDCVVSNRDSSQGEFREEAARKVRTPHGIAGANGPPSQDEEQWNRENVRGIDPSTGNGTSKGSRRSENSQTLRGARSNRGAWHLARDDCQAIGLVRPARSFRVRSLKGASNRSLRGIVASLGFRSNSHGRQNPAYRKSSSAILGGFSARESPSSFCSHEHEEEEQVVGQAGKRLARQAGTSLSGERLPEPSGIFEGIVPPSTRSPDSS